MSFKKRFIALFLVLALMAAGTVIYINISGDTFTVNADARVVATFFKSGDANGDGYVTLADAVAVVNYILGNPSEDFNASNADVDGNGSITITDAVSIVNMVLPQ